ncbi:MAG: GerAB/ArcD/ProY family transporter [Clostridia bacterium]|nr:GerAB/ArcD/ProY family transporter [Clostridia bacterium]
MIYSLGKDLIDICEYAGGNFLKRVFGIACCIYFLTISAFIIRIFAESLVLIYFPDIHIEFVILVFIAITAITNLFGFKSISRVTLITLPIILISMVIIFISSASNFVPQRALPLLGYGAYDTFVSGLGNIFAFSSMIIAPFLMPFIGTGKNLRKAGGLSIVVYFVYLLLGIVSLLFLIPSITNINNTLSIYILSRRANFGTFIQRIDAVFILIWIMSIFNYLAITMHFSLVTFKKITNIKHESGMIFCFAGILYIISLIPQSISDVNFFDGTIYKYSSIMFVFFVTVFILLWAYIKKRKSLRKGGV